MACKYSVTDGPKSQQNLSLDELKKVLKVSDSALDIVFSQSAKTKQDQVSDKIYEAREAARKSRFGDSDEEGKEIFESKGALPLDGDQDLAHSEDTYTPNSLIDSAYFQIDGTRPFFQIDTMQYVQTTKKLLVDKCGYTEEQADAWGSTVQAKWDHIADVGKEFHELIMAPIPGLKGSDPSYIARENSSWIDVTDNSKYFKNMAGEMHDVEQDIFFQVSKRNGRDRRGFDSNARFMKNVYLEADLHGMASKIFGHIDYLVVRSDGEVDMYLVKTSTEPFEAWPSAKKEKYKYQLALLKQMLAYNGVDPRTVHLNIVPVQLKFDNNYDAVEGAVVHPAVQMDVQDMMYTFKKYDNVAAQFIESKVSFERASTALLQQTSDDLQHMFPGRDVLASGIQDTAKEWVRNNWRRCQPKPRPGMLGWTVKIPGEAKEIELTDARRGDKNEEFIQIVQQKMQEENDAFTGDMSAHRLKTELANAYRSGVYAPNEHMGWYVREQFAKYFTHTEDENGKYTYDWKMIDSGTLDMANVIMFQRVTGPTAGQIDVFVITSLDPGKKYKFKGRNNLLGYYLPDLNNENFDLECNYGNIEMFRGLALVNRMLPEIDGVVKPGKIQVMNLNKFSRKKGVFAEFSQVLPQFAKALNIINRNTEANIPNNFAEQGVECVSPEEVLAQTFDDIMLDPTSLAKVWLEGVADLVNGRTEISGEVVDGVINAKTVEAKLEKLEQLYERLRKLAERENVPLNNMEELVKLANASYDKDRTYLAKMLVNTMRAISAYNGDISLTNEDFSQLQEYAMKMSSIKNSSVRRVGYLVQKAIDNIRDTIVNDFTSRVRPIFDEYYKACGYTTAQNALIGNQAKVFEHLYQLDEDGERMLVFKNPYDESSDLAEHERKFLKHILYEFYRVRCGIFDVSPEITGINDPKLKTNMPEGYLNIPLQKASRATNSWMRDPMRAAKAWGMKIHRLCTHPGDYIDEVTEALSSEDSENRDNDAAFLRTYNPYTRTLIQANARNSFIDERGVDWFETNVENVFTDFMAKAVQCKEFNRLLVRIKGIELALSITGTAEYNSTTDNLEKTAPSVARAIKAIQDFTFLNVFNRNPMEKSARTVDFIIEPFRRLVSKIYIAANPVALTRDILQGFQENFLMTAIKFQTDVNAKDVAFGYAEVFKEGSTNIMKMSRLNQFNVKYAFSNFDAAQVASMLKTGRTGVLNPDNWAYWTLRAPDYLNRMVLFIARMHHDGVYEAYSLDEQGRLKYDWRKDKRFSVLASGDTANPEFNKQQALYMSLIREFNVENPSLHLAYTDDLPDAYTMEEIRTIKSLGESIYGAYDKASKSKYEFITVGRNFLFFTTWMNGIVDSYFKSRQVSSTEVELQQETDYNGNKLYFTADRSGNVTTENTGIPVMRHVPIMVQGIFATFGQTIKEWHNTNFKEMVNTVYGNAVNRRNLRRAITDMLVMIILGVLFGKAIKPAYKLHKSEDDGTEFIKNTMIEILYKGSLSSFDTFKGPFAVAAYLGDSISPAAYTLQTKIVKDAYSLVMGDKSFGAWAMGTQAFLRAAQDSYRMYEHDHRLQTGVETESKSKKEK